ncbi:MAG: tRNA (adenosine(37)-N6)-dimethylallyltransferase MiaA [Bacteroidia bacterium]|nr:tRNA (adenosine(37)-N6)-dimethylallyltransferase MiaA [Bacteroidia bacterium]
MGGKQKLLICLVGPTASGKTALSIELARHLKTEIISCDSRQFYKEMKIGTAKPDLEEMQGIKHHFIDFLNPADYFSAGDFERAALKVLDELFLEKDFVIVCGGSGLYLNALLFGLDEMPAADLNYRTELELLFKEKGLEGLQELFRLKNPIGFENTDMRNPQRLMRALEMQALGIERKERIPAKRNFEILVVGIDRPREELYARINERVNHMIQSGLVEEARKLYPFRNLNSLQTVGYNELFSYFDGEWNLNEAIDKIKQHTRNYAKRQMTWFRKINGIRWIGGDSIEELLAVIEEKAAQ